MAEVSYTSNTFQNDIGNDSGPYSALLGSGPAGVVALLDLDLDGFPPESTAFAATKQAAG